MFWLQACGDAPLEPDRGVVAPQLIVVQGGNIYFLSITILPDTVPAGAMDTVEITVQIDSITSAFPGLVPDSVQIDLRATFQPDTGPPITQLDYKNFLINESPNEFFGYSIGNPGDTLGVTMLTDLNGRLEIPYVTHGATVSGAEVIDVLAFDGRFEVSNFDFIPVPIVIEDECPPDPWFQDQSVIDSLKAMWQRTNPGAQPQTNRQEEAGFIRQTGSGYQFIPINPTLQTPCKVGLPMPLIPPDSVVALVHAHTIAAGEQVQTGACGNVSPGMVVPGPSPGDAQGVGTARTASGLDVIGNVLDPDGIWRFEVTPGTTQWLIDQATRMQFGKCGIIN